ncbi:hypothetical protein AAG570_006739 [Ranatra chinensis]|uniref:Uncharacterized protein n=1 Tax=Ranatra chinensis TaxID=642074 RepID=A0ABD0Z7M4_9HEMI
MSFDPNSTAEVGDWQVLINELRAKDARQSTTGSGGSKSPGGGGASPGLGGGGGGGGGGPPEAKTPPASHKALQNVKGGDHPSIHSGPVVLNVEQELQVELRYDPRMAFLQNRSISLVDMYIDNSEPSENVGQIHFSLEYDFQNTTLILRILTIGAKLEEGPRRHPLFKTPQDLVDSHIRCRLIGRI